MSESNELLSVTVDQQSVILNQQAVLDAKIASTEKLAAKFVSTLDNAVVIPDHPGELPKLADGSPRGELLISKDQHQNLTNIVKDLLKKVTELKEEASEISFNVAEAIKRIDELAQYMRRECLLIHGLRLPPSTVTGIHFIKYIVGQINNLMPGLDMPLSWEDISVAHPLPTASGKKTCIIVRFVRRFIALDIFKHKRCLKGTDVTVTEHLTKKNLALLEHARTATSFKRAWSKQGKIYVVYNKQKIHIKSKEHLDSLGDISVEQLVENEPTKAILLVMIK